MLLFGGQTEETDSQTDRQTSEGRFHGSLHHADEQLETLGVLGEAGGERRQGVGVTAQVLQGNPLTEVGLREKPQFLIHFCTDVLQGRVKLCDYDFDLSKE